MIVRERIEIINQNEINPYRQKMMELIHTANKNDKQKDGRVKEQIDSDLSDLEKNRQKIIDEYISNCQKCNSHPQNIILTIEYNIELVFYNFNKIPKKPIYHNLFGGDNDLASRGCINGGEYIEPQYISKLIERWYKINKKEIPLNLKKVTFYFDFNFRSAIIDGQWNLLSSGRVDEIKNLEYCKIYHHYKNNRTDKNRLRKNKKRVSGYFKYYSYSSNLLSDEEHYTNRGYTIIDFQNLFKINGKTVFEFYSKFFWVFFDSLFELQLIKPEFFGKGADIIVEGLFDLMTSKEDFKNVRFLENKKEFILALQQNYAYFGDTEKGLRVDLFRNIVEDKNKKDTNTFEGGLFHVLRHFENDKNPIGPTFEGGHQFYESYFFNTLIEAFFVSEWKNEKNKITSIVHSHINQDKNYQFGFYKNPHAYGLYFIDTMYLKNKTNK